MEVLPTAYLNAIDLILVRNNQNTTAEEVSYSSVDNPYFFTGRTTDTLHTSSILVSSDPNFKRLQDNRNRTYDPKHGRWLQRDPIGVRVDAQIKPIAWWAARRQIKPRVEYSDGMDLYQYVRSRPTVFSDSRGLYTRSQCCGDSYDYCARRYDPFWEEQKFWACMNEETDCNGEGGGPPCPPPSLVGDNSGPNRNCFIVQMTATDCNPHCWTEWPGDSVGFWPDPGRGCNIHPDPYQTEENRFKYRPKTSNPMKDITSSSEVLMHGMGAGKSCDKATCNEVYDCIKKIPHGEYIRQDNDCCTACDRVGQATRVDSAEGAGVQVSGYRCCVSGGGVDRWRGAWQSKRDIIGVY